MNEKIYKVLLVDDEPLILSGIKFILDWEKNNCELVGTSRNGRQALDFIENNMPDIVVADINMPVMNGMELILAAKEKFPHIVFILLTNLEEFELARDALRLGAVDYIIKNNLEAAVLEKSLEAAKNESDKRSLISNIELEENFIKVGKKDLLQKAILMIIRNNNFKEKNIKILEDEKILDGYGIIQILLEKTENKELVNWANEMIEKLLENCFPKHITIITEESQIFISYWGLSDNSMYKNYLDMFYKKLRQISASIIGHIPVVLATSLIIGHDFDLCHSQLEALNNYYFNTASGFIRFDDISEPSFKKIHIGSLAEKLKAELNNKSFANCESLINKLIAEMEEYNFEKNHVVWLCLELYSIASDTFGAEKDESYFSAQENVYEIETLYTRNAVINWLKKFKNELERCLEPYSHGRSLLLERVKEYINDNIDKRIFLQDAADYACISSSYLSAIFKKEYDYSFIDYVNKTKMEYACKLIAQSKYRISEISYMLGFENAYYFTKVFKKNIGMVPTEYRHKIKNEKNGESFTS